ncbi:MAG: transposase [Acidobacteria bacterium]|nr:transposase [Acidobacteriota bacterium]
MLNREFFDTLLEIKVDLERWRWEFNWIRPHSFPGNRPPASAAILTEKLSLGEYKISLLLSSAFLVLSSDLTN